MSNTENVPVMLSENARTVIERRIAARDKDGNPTESAEQLFERVAKTIAEGDRQWSDDDKIANTADKFYRMMAEMRFLPNSPTLVNAGRELGQLSACFVLPVEDTMEDIFESVKNAALIHKSGGGTGFSFSRLRAGGEEVDSTSGVASGPVSFMSVFDKATEVIKQGGTRRGANMGILRIDHPDIRTFIHAKDEGKTLQNFNISVGITDDFMRAVEQDDDFKLIDPRDGRVVERVRATELWEEILVSAHKTGDPGVVFLDKINDGKANPVPTRGPIEATNPCGEQPLYPFDSCNLGSINLALFVNEGKPDFAALADTVYDAVHFLDNVVEVNKYPLPQIEEVSKSIRRIGLGVMGWAEMLIQCGIGYDTPEATLLAKGIMEFIQTRADEASTNLAMRRGSFPDFDGSIYAGGKPMRNSTRTTIAPTGTISIIAGCSSGIEPLYALAFKRSHYLDKTDGNKRTEMWEINKYLVMALSQVYPPQEVQEKLELLCMGAKLADITENTWILTTFRTAHDISPADHVLMQAAFQSFTDNAVSKTINFESEATVDDIRIAYKLAYATGCKGITVYRDGSHSEQVLFVPSSKSVLEVANGNDEQPSGIPTRRKLANTRSAINHSVRIGEQDFYLSLGMHDDGEAGELFIIGSKTGSTIQGFLNTIGVLFSYALQYGVDIGKLTDKLKGERFEPSGMTDNKDIPMATSIIDYIARWLQEVLEPLDSEDSQEYPTKPLGALSGDLCPDCQSQLYYGEGCLTCVNCAFSKCG